MITPGPAGNGSRPHHEDRGPESGSSPDETPTAPQPTVTAAAPPPDWSTPATRATLPPIGTVPAPAPAPPRPDPLPPPPRNRLLPLIIGLTVVLLVCGCAGIVSNVLIWGTDIF